MHRLRNIDRSLSHPFTTLGAWAKTKFKQVFKGMLDYGGVFRELELRQKACRKMSWEGTGYSENRANMNLNILLLFIGGYEFFLPKGVLEKCHCASFKFAGQETKRSSTIPLNWELYLSPCGTRALGKETAVGKHLLRSIIRKSSIVSWPLSA